MYQKVELNKLHEYVGKETGLSDWFNVDQDRINKFADVTLDHQYIHTDPEKAKDTPFGSTIAHGFLSLSLLSHLCEDGLLDVHGSKAVLNYGFDKVRFMSPIKVNSNIRARSELLDITEKGSSERLLLTYKITIEIEGEDKPALVANWLTMILN